MFSRTLGDEILQAVGLDTVIQGCAIRDSRTGEIFVKLVNPNSSAEPLNIKLNGITSLASKATAITLAGNPEDTNSIPGPRKMAPTTTTMRHLKPDFLYTMPPHSIVVLKLKTN